MAHSSDKIVEQGFLGSFLMPSFSSVIFTAILMVGWNYQMPVVYLLSEGVVDRTETTATLKIHGWKFKECQLVKGSFVGWHISSDGYWIETNGPVEFPDDTSPDSNRPRNLFSPNDYGLFKLNGIERGTERVRITVNHACNAKDIPVTTTLGPWDIEKYKGS